MSQGHSLKLQVFFPLASYFAGCQVLSGFFGKLLGITLALGVGRGLRSSFEDVRLVANNRVFAALAVAFFPWIVGLAADRTTEILKVIRDGVSQDEPPIPVKQT